MPEEEKDLMVDLALKHIALSSIDLAPKILDEQGIFISESSIYWILK